MAQPVRLRWGVALAALALSVGLHLAVVLAFRPDRPPVEATPSTNVPIEVELRPERDTPVAEPVSATRPGVRSKLGTGSRPKQTRVPAPPAAEAVPPPGPTVPDAPRVQGSLLVPSPSALEKVVPRGLDGTSPSTPQDLVASTVREAIGRGKVDRGLVHPYFGDLGKALMKSWDAERAVSAHGLKGYGEQLGENTRLWGAVWQDRARQFGGTGSPSSEVDTARLATRAPGTAEQRELAGAPNLTARDAIRREMAQQFRTSRKAWVRVVQDRTGRIVKVDLVKPSTNPELDHDAVEDVRAASANLPKPPLEAYAGHETLTSLWELELIISITPPIPTLTFEFDEALKFFDPRMPLDRRLYKRVRLVSLDAGP